MKELFKQFLTQQKKQSNGKHYAISTAENYSSAITYLSSYFKLKLWFLDDNSIDKIEEIIEKVSLKGSDKMAGDIYSNAGRTSISLYKEFREFLIQNKDFIIKNTKKNINKANEKFLEEIIEDNFASIEIFKNFVIKQRQFKSNNYRYDLLLEHKSENEFIIVEIKDTPILPNSITQLVVYINDFQEKNKDKKIKGVLIGRYLTKSANELFEKNLKNCNIDFYSFNIGISLDQIKS